MPYLGRHEKLEDYPTPGVTCHRESLKVSEGTRLVLCRSFINLRNTHGNESTHTFRNTDRKARRRRIKVVYLQGNASSTPPRLPPLSKILSLLQRTHVDLDVEIWTVAYRGYWESTGRPSESGLLQDVRDSLAFILHRARQENKLDDEEVEVVVWGHSIGASLALMTLPHLTETMVMKEHEGKVQVKVILETPFDSVSSVLRELYPQRWLPYRYLSPFLRTRLDISQTFQQYSTEIRNNQKIWEFLAQVPILLVKAERDEIVPGHVSDKVTELLRHYGIGRVTTAVVRGGLHQDCLFKPEMHRLVTDFIASRPCQKSSR